MESRYHFKRACPGRHYAGEIKKNKMKTTLYTMIAAMLICSNSFAQQQNQENEKHRYAGFGIRLPGIQVSDVDSRVIPPARVIASLDPIEYFRIEAQYGFNATKTQSDEPSADKIELKGSTSVFSLGAMGMYPKGNARFIFGMRYGIGNYKQESWATYPDKKIVESHGKTKTITGVLGGEYLIAKCFSIGCEFTVSSMKDEYRPAMSDNGPIASKVSLSEGNVILKFYPF